MQEITYPIAITIVGTIFGLGFVYFGLGYIVRLTTNTKQTKD